MAGAKNSSFLGCLGSLIVVAVFLWFILPDSWTNALLYSTEYSVDTSNVHTKAKPTDCDWGHAPLGGKGCHFEKEVTGYNAAGEIVVGDGAPKYGNDTKTGKPIISYDNGKTWNWIPDDAPQTPDLKIKRIEVDWNRVTD